MASASFGTFVPKSGTFEPPSTVQRTGWLPAPTLRGAPGKTPVCPFSVTAYLSELPNLAAFFLASMLEPPLKSIAVHALPGSAEHQS